MGSVFATAWGEFATGELAGKVIIPAGISALVAISLNAAKEFKDRQGLRHKRLEDSLSGIQKDCDLVWEKIEHHLRGVTEESNLSESKIIITTRVKKIRTQIELLKDTLGQERFLSLVGAYTDWNEVQTDSPFPLSAKKNKLPQSAPELRSRAEAHTKLCATIVKIINESQHRRFRL